MGTWHPATVSSLQAPCTREGGRFPAPAHHCSWSQGSKVSTRSWPRHTRTGRPTPWSPCLALSFLIYHLSNISSFSFCLESSFWSLLQLALGLHPRGPILNLAVHLPSHFLPLCPPQSLRSQGLAKPLSEMHQEIIHPGSPKCCQLPS